VSESDEFDVADPVEEKTPEELEQILAAEKVADASAELNASLAGRSQTEDEGELGGDPSSAAPSEVVHDVAEMTARAWEEKRAREAAEAPAPLIGELVEEEEPPDETQPLLPAVNRSVGPETAFARAERYRIMHQEALAELEAGMPDDSVWASFIRNERERDARMEPIRAAFIKSMQDKR